MKRKFYSIFMILLIAGSLALAACTSMTASAADLVGVPGECPFGLNNCSTSGSRSYENARGQGSLQGRSRGGQGVSSFGLAQGPLSEEEIEGLVRAIQEEFGAQALYQSVLEQFGDVFLFNRIVPSEGQHASALIRQAEKYGVPIPDYPAAEGLPTFATLSEACQAGVEAEIADAALYDELMASTTHQELLWVYQRLQSASLTNHLPAFEACQ